MGRELEWKYAATLTELNHVRESFGIFDVAAMEATYYDTPAGDLAARRMTLRLRRRNATAICTLKTPLPDGSRGEWEVAAETIEEGIKALCKLDCPQEFRSLAVQEILPVCGAAFSRLSRLEVLPDCAVELALDLGHLIGGCREQAFSEMEVEYLSGSEEAAQAFAEALAQKFSLSPEPRSKFHRAQLLAKGEL